MVRRRAGILAAIANRLTDHRQHRRLSPRRFVRAIESPHAGRALALRFEPLESRVFLSTTPLISEFMAANGTILLDGNGVASDWIEVHNPADSSLDLTGWFLTDDAADLEKWAFPDAAQSILGPGEYLVVFASGQSASGPLDAAGNFHTNFKLRSSGEYLALARPDGTVAHEYASTFPPQFEDIAYGLAPRSTVPIDEGDRLKYRVPTAADGTLATAWTNVDFDDSSWAGDSTTVTGIGYLTTDAGGGGNDGTVIGTVDLSDSVPAGAPAGAQSYDVTDARINTNDIDLLHNTLVVANGGFTYDVWFNWDGSRAGNTNAKIIDYAGTEFIRVSDVNGTIDFQLSNNATYTVVSPVTAQPNTWHHVIAEFDTTGQSIGGDGSIRGTMRLTVDGITVSGLGTKSTFGDDLDRAVGIGDHPLGFSSCDFHGKIYAATVLFGPTSHDAAVPVFRYDAPVSGSGPEILDRSGGFPASHVATDIESDMLGQNASVYLRQQFVLEDPIGMGQLVLDVRYDDGFVAYLNGTPVASRNAPAEPQFDATATAARAGGEARRFESIDISDHVDLLRGGLNVLAIHGMNVTATDGDFLMTTRLSAATTDPASFAQAYLRTPTPGATNSFTDALLGPLVADVAALPDQPTTNEPLIVTTRITSNQHAVDAVTLHYRVMYNDEMVIAMRDDGAGGDQIAGDRIFTGTMAPTLAAAGQMVRYYVTASDTEGNTSRAPFLPDAATPLGFAEYYGTVVRDPSVVTRLPVFQWFVPDPDWHMNFPGQPSAGNNRSWSPASVYYDGEFYDNLQVRVRGTSTSLNWRKPKLKFEFNESHEFRYADDEERVDEFNLQSHYVEVLFGDTDVSYMRENIANQFLQEIGVPASTTFHMHVRQNGEFYGLSSFVEQVDKTFLRRYGFDDRGAMYKATPTVQSTLAPHPTPAVYRKVNRADQPYDDLVGLTDGINGRLAGVDVETYLLDNVNVPEVINNMAGNVILLNHDRLTKNYYMYRDTEGDGLWSRFPWDTEQAFSNPPWPHFTSLLYGDSEHTQGTSNQTIYQNHLLDAILDTPRTRAMYVRRVRTLMDEYLGPEPSYFEAAVAALAAEVEFDAALDHAKWSAGTLADGVDDLLANIDRRRAQLAADPYTPGPQVGNPTLALAAIDFNPVSGNQDEEFVQLINPNPFAVDISGWQVTGGVQFTFQPGTVIPAADTLYLAADLTAFRSRASGPSGGQAIFVQGPFVGHLSSFGETLNLIAADGSPIATLTYAGQPSDPQQHLRISEINYHPYSAMPQFGEANVDDGQFEFIEVVNRSTTVPLDLTGVHFSRGIDFAFEPDTLLAPGQRMVVVRNEPAFASRYGAGIAVAGEFANGTGLSNQGETIQLDDGQGSTIVELTYDDAGKWPSQADGQGATLEMVDPEGDGNDADNWHSSYLFGGTPGAVGGTLVDDVIINEVLARSSDSTGDKVELLNTADRAVDLTFWHLRNGSSDDFLLTFAAGTWLQPHEYMVLGEAELGFSLDGQQGDYLWLIQGDPLRNGRPVRFADHQDIEATATNVSLGRVAGAAPTAPGATLFPMIQQTFGAANSGFVVGEVIISELLANPAPVPPAEVGNIDRNELEFVELTNTTDTLVDLSGWTLRQTNGDDFFLPVDVTLPNHGSLVLVGFDPLTEPGKAAAFRRIYGIDSSVALAGPYAGQLDNDGETIKLMRPEEPTSQPTTRLLLVDRVAYDDAPPWPVDTAGSGQSLTRNAADAFGDFAASWSAAIATPGWPSLVRIGDVNGDGRVNGLDIDPFIAALLGGTYHAAADTNRDGIVNGLDVQPFVTIVLVGVELPGATRE